MYVVPCKSIGNKKAWAWGVNFSWENRAMVSIVLVRTVKIFFANNKFILCKDVYMVSVFRRKKNLLSISRMIDHDYSLNFNNSIY